MKKNLINKKTVFFLCCIILAIASLLCNEKWIKNVDSLLYNVFLTVCLAVLTTCFLSLVDNVWGSSIDEIATEKFHELKCCHEYGLIGIDKDFPWSKQAIENDFLNSSEVYIVMNDAKRLISDHRMLFEKRMKKPAYKTVFIIQDYSQEDIMTALARKNGHENSYYIGKIKEILCYDICSLKKVKAETHELNVYLNNNFTTLSVILMNEHAMFSIYRNASGKTEVPHFIFKRGLTEYELIHKDVNKLLTDLTPLKLEDVVQGIIGEQQEKGTAMSHIGFAKQVFKI